LAKISPEWAEQQHLNYLMRVIDKTLQEDDDKPKKLSSSELQKFVVPD
jgi:hypothetical protein